MDLFHVLYLDIKPGHLICLRPATLGVVVWREPRAGFSSADISLQQVNKALTDLVLLTQGLDRFSVIDTDSQAIAYHEEYRKVSI